MNYKIKMKNWKSERKWKHLLFTSKGRSSDVRDSPVKEHIRVASQTKIWEPPDKQKVEERNTTTQCTSRHWIPYSPPFFSLLKLNILSLERVLTQNRRWVWKWEQFSEWVSARSQLEAPENGAHKKALSCL